MTNSSTKKYAFVLGRERDLCLAELRAVLSRFGFCFDPERSRMGFADLILSDNVAFINLPAGQAGLDSDPRKLIDILGGTTKIFEIIETSRVILSETKNPSDPSAAPQDDNIVRRKIKELISERAKSVSGKINFGFSAYGRHRANQLNALGLNIKKDLKDHLSLRFIAIKEKELSTIVSSKNNLATAGLELGFFNDQIGVLIAVTDPEAWSERDYGKPRGDKFSGMVPPKLARAMVNIALAQNSKSEARNSKQIQNSNLKNSKLVSDLDHRPLVVDPFCGSGNILLEAMMLGCNVFGSDVSEKAVNDTRENLKWLAKKLPVTSYQLPVNFQLPNYQINIYDATSPTLIDNWKLIFGNSDDYVVVTEPYLGEPKKYLSSIRAVRGEYEKVKELYLSFLENLRHLSLDLSRPLVLCLVFPLVETVEKIKFSLYSESVDEIKKIGYTELAKPLIYGRDYQVVKREIVLLQL